MGLGVAGEGEGGNKELAACMEKWGEGAEGYDDEAHEWKLSPVEFRKQLNRLGFVDA